MNTTQRLASIEALEILAENFEHLMSETDDYPQPLPMIYTARDMWDQAAEMTRDTIDNYLEGWDPH